MTQSSAPDDGHMVARNMLSNYLKRNKEYKKWHLVGAATAHTNKGYNITQSSAPDDGHMVTRNMLSNY